MKIGRILSVSKERIPAVKPKPQEVKAFVTQVEFDPEFTAHVRHWFVDVEHYLNNKPDAVKYTVGSIGRDAQEAWSLAIAKSMKNASGLNGFIQSYLWVFKGARVIAERSKEKLPPDLPLLPNILECVIANPPSLDDFPKAKRIRIPLTKR